LIDGDDNIVDVTSYLDGRSGAAGTNYAVYLYGDRNKLIANIVDSGTAQVRGVQVYTGATDNEIVSLSYSDTGLTSIDDSGTRTKVSNGNGSGGSIASAAGIVIPINGDFFTITGTAAIDTITAKGTVAGRTIKFKFASTASLTTGGNVIGTFSGSENDIATLVFDGTSWVLAGTQVN
jgi:hypothetical protein